MFICVYYGLNSKISYLQSKGRKSKIRFNIFINNINHSSKFVNDKSLTFYKIDLNRALRQQ